MTSKKSPSTHPALLAAVLVVALAAASGCAAQGAAIDHQAQLSAGRDVPAAPTAEDFPAIDSATWKQGTFPSIDALRSMNTGMGKDQVRGLLSWPHFSEGLGGVREWNYLFHFRTGPGAAFVTCQYMVRFNADMLTNGLYWKDPDCARWTEARAVPAASVATTAAAVAAAPLPVGSGTSAAPPAGTLPPARQIELRTDSLFRFGKSLAADLLPAGRRSIEALGAEIQRRFQPVEVQGGEPPAPVTGHALSNP